MKKLTHKICQFIFIGCFRRLFSTTVSSYTLQFPTLIQTQKLVRGIELGFMLTYGPTVIFQLSEAQANEEYCLQFKRLASKKVQNYYKKVLTRKLTSTSPTISTKDLLLAGQAQVHSVKVQPVLQGGYQINIYYTVPSEFQQFFSTTQRLHYLKETFYTDTTVIIPEVVHHLGVTTQLPSAEELKLGFFLTQPNTNLSFFSRELISQRQFLTERQSSQVVQQKLPEPISVSSPITAFDTPILVGFWILTGFIKKCICKTNTIQF